MKRIKRFVIGLMGLSALYGAPTQAEKWVYVTQRDADADRYSTTYSIDVNSLDQTDEGDAVIIWQREQYEERENTLVFAKYQFFCNKNEMILKQWERFVDDYPVEVFTWTPDTQRIQSIVVGSVSEDIFKAACALR